ncbi:hypothetical protein PFISCL1PPCAC_7574, partial [Pristionchus fissidentatus]
MKIQMRIASSQESVVANVECDLRNVKYVYNNKHNSVTESDVFSCRYDECKDELTPIFEIESCPANELCEKFTEIEVNKYGCRHEFELRVRKSGSSEWKLEKYFHCHHGQLRLGEYLADKNIKAKCMKPELCTERNPMKSVCPTSHCETIFFENYATINCNEEFEMEIAGREGEELSDLDCDMESGVWSVLVGEEDEKEIIPAGTNIYCIDN